MPVGRILVTEEADAEGDQIVHGSPTAASELPTTPISSDRGRVDGSSAPDTPGRVAESERSAPAADADAEHGGEHDDDVFSGRPDLAQDAIETLRARNKQLKKEYPYNLWNHHMDMF